MRVYEPLIKQPAISIELKQYNDYYIIKEGYHSFKNATFKPTQNVLIALGPGYGTISQTNTSTRPCAYYNIPDSDIPSNDTKSSDLTIQNTNIYYGGKLIYILKDNFELHLQGLDLRLKFVQLFF